MVLPLESELKCSAISFTTSNNLLFYEANGKQIPSKYNQKDLSITVSSGTHIINSLHLNPTKYLVF